jgi:hypothetical protein
VICEESDSESQEYLFYKTLNGAHIGDLFMSLIHTCEQKGANPFHYLTELLRHAEESKQKPAEWMPWKLPCDADAPHRLPQRNMMAGLLAGKDALRPAGRTRFKCV